MHMLNLLAIIIVPLLLSMDSVYAENSSDIEYFDKNHLKIGLDKEIIIIDSLGDKANNCNTKILTRFELCLRTSDNVEMINSRNNTALSLFETNAFIHILKKDYEDYYKRYCELFETLCNTLKNTSKTVRSSEFMKLILRVTPLDLLNANKEDMDFIKTILDIKDFYISKTAIQINKIKVGHLFQGYISRTKNMEYVVHLFSEKQYVVLVGKGYEFNRK